ncbi:MAG: nucleoside-diphosphate kinase [Patescibacteria group bacterium]|nr:nucleoside-diphosphate kinase [Patescibacteria group bacterium]
MHPKKEKTFVILKPDAVQRGLVGDILNRFERIGLKIVAMKMILPTEEMCLMHYNKDDAWMISKGENNVIKNRKELGLPIEKSALEYGKDIMRGLVEFMICSPVVVMVLEGNSAQAVVKRLVGTTEPATSDTGTIRGDLSLETYMLCDTDGGRAVRNLIHCTDPADGKEAAEREINVWFKPEEIIKWKSINEKMLYDVNLEGHLE